jgi:hypothetical protein
MNTQKTKVVTDCAETRITINGQVRQCYPGPRGLRCNLSHEHVRALGIEPSRGDNYELINGDTLRTLSGPGRGHIEKLALPVLFYDGSALPVETLLDPLPSQAKPARPLARARRTMGRKWLPLVDAIARLNLPPEHEVSRALAAALRLE